MLMAWYWPCEGRGRESRVGLLYITVGVEPPVNAKRMCCRMLGTEQLQYVLTGFVVPSASRVCASAAAMGLVTISSISWHIIAQWHYEQSGVSSREVVID
jgi:hypothetical protein